MNFKIDSDIPLPAMVRKGAGKRKYQWDSMEVGDSHFIEKDKGQFSTLARKACPDAKFSQRSVVEDVEDEDGTVRENVPGMRVWRTA